jgi:hypothetical protein
MKPLRLFIYALLIACAVAVIVAGCWALTL